MSLAFFLKKTKDSDINMSDFCQGYQILLLFVEDFYQFNTILNKNFLVKKAKIEAIFLSTTLFKILHTVENHLEGTVTFMYVLYLRAKYM